MSNIDWIRIPKISGSIQENISNSLNHRSLFSLSNIQNIKQTLVTVTDIEDVAENVTNEFVKLVSFNNRRVSFAEWLDKDRFDNIEIPNILFFLTDELLNDPVMYVRAITWLVYCSMTHV